DAAIARTGNLAQVAANIAKHFDERAKKGEFDQKAAREQTHIMLDALRYGENNSGYFFAQDMDGNSIINGANPAKEGVNGLTTPDPQDPTGKQRTENMIAVARTGAGHVFYSYQKPGETVQIPKVSSLVTYQPWNWYFGTGTYLTDISAAFWASTWKLAGAS